MVKYEEGKESKITVFYNAAKVKLPGQRVAVSRGGEGIRQGADDALDKLPDKSENQGDYLENR